MDKAILPISNALMGAGSALAPGVAAGGLLGAGIRYMLLRN